MFDLAGAEGTEACRVEAEGDTREECWWPGYRRCWPRPRSVAWPSAARGGRDPRQPPAGDGSRLAGGGSGVAAAAIKAVTHHEAAVEEVAGGWERGDLRCVGAAVRCCPPSPPMDFRRTGEVTWELVPEGGMPAPGEVFASSSLFAKAEADKALQQVANVAHLPGIVGASFAMPDIHWGYGFPIGGVAATDVAAAGWCPPAEWASTSAAGCACWPRRSPRRTSARTGPGSWPSWMPVSPGAGQGGAGRRAPARRRPRARGGGGGRRRLRGARDLERCEERGTSAGARPGAISSGRGSGAPGSWGRWGPATTSWRSRWWTGWSTRGRRRPSASPRAWSR